MLWQQQKVYYQKEVKHEQSQSQSENLSEMICLMSSFDQQLAQQTVWAPEPINAT